MSSPLIVSVANGPSVVDAALAGGVARTWSCFLRPSLGPRRGRGGSARARLTRIDPCLSRAGLRADRARSGPRGPDVLTAVAGGPMTRPLHGCRVIPCRAASCGEATFAVSLSAGLWHVDPSAVRVLRHYGVTHVDVVAATAPAERS